MRPRIASEPVESPMAGGLRLPARLLFRFGAPCRHSAARWARGGVPLGPEHRLPCLQSLETGKPGWADFRMAWNEKGLLFSVAMRGAKPSPPSRAIDIDDADGVSLWIDTRDVHDVHRATRYCHRFFFWWDQRDVGAFMATIHNSRGKPKVVDNALLRGLSVAESDRLRIDGFIPAAAMTGFDPVEYPRLGFNYSVRCRGLGEQTFSSGSPLPFRTDPSLWGTLDLLPPEPAKAK